MNENYRSYAPPKALPITFSSRMRECLERKISAGQKGINRAAIYDGKRPDDVVIRYHTMSGEIFDLGCDLQAKVPDLDYHAWVAWMADAEVKHFSGRVAIYHRSNFFCERAKGLFGEIIKRHFGKPVEFIADANIRLRVEQ